jgi:D-hydroxyproline dehydrogenase subunit gamma
MNLRLTKHTQRGAPCEFQLDATRVEAFLGETVAAALIAGGLRTFREDSLRQARGPFCNMGTCFECVLEMQTELGWQTARACLTRVTPGLKLRRLSNVPRDDHTL